MKTVAILAAAGAVAANQSASREFLEVVAGKAATPAPYNEQLDTFIHPKPMSAVVDGEQMIITVEDVVDSVEVPEGFIITSRSVVDGKTVFEVAVPTDYKGVVSVYASVGGHRARAGAIVRAEAAQATIISYNDFHGRLGEMAKGTTSEPGSTAEMNDVLGMAVAAHIRSVQKEFKTSITIQAGDTIGASQFMPAILDEVPAIDWENWLNVALGVVGNHEFDKGYDRLLERVDKEWNFPILGGNVIKEEDGAPILPSTATAELGGLKLGFIGGVTDEVPTLVVQSGIQGLEFADGLKLANEEAIRLKEEDEVDLTIFVFHQGLPSGGTVAEAVANCEDETSAKCTEYGRILKGLSDDIDIVIGGHTHVVYLDELPKSDGSFRPVIQMGTGGANLGLIHLTYDPETKDVAEISTEKRVTAEFWALSGGIEKAIEDYDLGELADMMNKDFEEAYPVGAEAVGRIYESWTRDSRDVEGRFPNQVAESMMFGAAKAGKHADVAFMNPGGVRADLTYSEATSGEVTYREVYNCLPFGNLIAIVPFTGQTIIDVLEEQFRETSDIVLGTSNSLRYSYDATKPVGSRVIKSKTFINDELIDTNKTYYVASNNFLFGGGDGFSSLEGLAKMDNIGFSDTELLPLWMEDVSPNPLELQKLEHAIDDALDMRPVTRLSCVLSDDESSVTLTMTSEKLDELLKTETIYFGYQVGDKPYVLGEFATEGEVTIKLENELPEGDPIFGNVGSSIFDGNPLPDGLSVRCLKDGQSTDDTEDTEPEDSTAPSSASPMIVAGLAMMGAALLI